MPDDLYKAERRLDKRRLFTTAPRRRCHPLIWLLLICSMTLAVVWYLQPDLLSSLLP